MFNRKIVVYITYKYSKLYTTAMEKLQTLRKRERRAVAPIIATLLMVAIAVVGGILIFVFTQGFFEDSSISSSPTNDSYRVLGYDARDVADIENAGGTTGGCTGGGAANGGLEADDIFNVYIRNAGEQPLTLERVKVFGLEYELTASLTCGAVPAGEFGVYAELADPFG